MLWSLPTTESQSRAAARQRPCELSARATVQSAVRRLPHFCCSRWCLDRCRDAHCAPMVEPRARLTAWRSGVLPAPLLLPVCYTSGAGWAFQYLRFQSMCAMAMRRLNVNDGGWDPRARTYQSCEVSTLADGWYSSHGSHQVSFSSSKIAHRNT
jgi:hypothetical protein